MNSSVCSECQKELSAEERLLYAMFGGTKLPMCFECNIEDNTTKCNVCGVLTQLMKNGTPLCPKHM